MLPALATIDTFRNQVIHCKAETLLASLPARSIDLIVTSPPYDSLRTYKGFEWDFEAIARESYRVLKPGGVLVWVVGDSTVNGSETLTSFKQAIFFRECAGFNLHDTMIYEKSTTAFPESNRYLQLFEFMFVLSKGKPQKSKLLRENTIYKHSRSVYRDSGGNTKPMKYAMGHDDRVLGNVWRLPVGYMVSTLDKEAFAHPAIFPEKLAERHILTWSNPGDVVLDFFGGSGTTAKMARANGRNFITCDISAEYCDLMTKRLFETPYTPPLFADPQPGESNATQLAFSEAVLK